MALSSCRGQVIVEVLWVSLVVFTLILFIAYFSFQIEDQQAQHQFHSWSLK